jgi:hypothetical protein
MEVENVTDNNLLKENYNIQEQASSAKDKHNM